MSFTEDHAAYLGPFGTDGTLANAPVRVIFDAPGSVVNGMSIAEPLAQLPTSSVPEDYFGAALVLPQGSFTVREHLPDGAGWSVLVLSKAVP